MARRLCPPRLAPHAALCAALVAVVPLAGCEKVPFLGPNRDADGRAVGGACRHAGRALADCYAYNPELPKAAIFAGWREMNDYMMEKKLDVVQPEIPAEVPKPPPPEGEEHGEEAAEPEKPSRRERARAERAELRGEARAEARPSVGRAEPVKAPEERPGPPPAERPAEGKPTAAHPDAKAPEPRPEVKPPPGGTVRPEPAKIVAAAEPRKDAAKEKEAPGKKAPQH